LKASYWLFVGALVGFAAGSIFGVNYAIAGIGIGMAGGIAISLTMRGRY
jgi:hypothetical protein